MQRSWDRTRGFTLVEVLVVISIISVLAALLFPVFATAREKSRQSVCTNNQRQIAAMVAIYAQDHDEILPSSTTVWSDLNLAPGILICPTAGKSVLNGYDFDMGLSLVAVGIVADPTSVFVTADGNGAGNVAKDLTYLTPIHSGKVITSFLDGHVSTVSVGNLSIFTTATTNSMVVTNPSFEYPAEADGTWTNDMTGSNWTQSGSPIGIENSVNAAYANTSKLGGIDRTLPQPFDGYQFCYFNGTGYISQDLIEHAIPGVTYTLTVGIGCPFNAQIPNNLGVPQYNVELLFNGVSKSTTTYPAPEPAVQSGQVMNVSATYTAVSADINATITVKLSATGNTGTTPEKQANFDNVRVTKTQN